MILKVPVYVEILSIDPHEIQGLVDVFNKEFYRILRKQDFNKSLKKYKSKETGISWEDFKIISKDQAFEALRKGIK